MFVLSALLSVFYAMTRDWCAEGTLHFPGRILDSSISRAEYTVSAKASSTRFGATVRPHFHSDISMAHQA